MKTILVVDDERDLLSAVSGVLSDEGYEVLECADGREALERVARKKPDAALIDVMMPVMDGIELVDLLRKDPRLDGLPIILMSAVEGPDIAKSKISAFLKKPFKLQRLLQLIDQLS